MRAPVANRTRQRANGISGTLGRLFKRVFRGCLKSRVLISAADSRIKFGIADAGGVFSQPGNPSAHFRGGGFELMLYREFASVPENHLEFGRVWIPFDCMG